ncbi:hypothetical protein [Bhargavaea ginsengi]|uniref:hypothetical protein n=1 Tax=Bhargavaea ginsengi TaxID=426757 RepID=UPI00203A87A2|nr:hypothetical protein [Bhargavaea ginsengi]MCM3087734.1 hypothetical protein [Bhargavaea ginsengi]
MTDNPGEGKDKTEETSKPQDESQQDKKQQDKNDGSLNDREMAILLLSMEESLCRSYQDADNHAFSTKLASLLASFNQSSDKNRRNLRDLVTRHGWLSPQPAKREDFDKAIQKSGEAPPPVV